MGEPPKEEKKQEEQAVPNENGTKPPPQMTSVPQNELDELKKSSEEYKDKYLRLLADMDNARKRMQKERLELIQHAMQNIIVDFLHPIDQMENALKFANQMSDEVKQWAHGFQMILNQFKDVLSNHGVTPFDSVGTMFDPHRHEAVEVVSTKEHPPGTVVSESVRGYKMGDKIIRPSRVKVAKEPEDENSAAQEKTNNQ